MKNLKLLTLAALIIAGCNANHSSVNDNKAIPDTTNTPIPKAITLKTSNISAYFQYNRNKITAFAKLKGKDSVLKMKLGDTATYQVDYYYNVLKDTTGKIVLIRCMPFNEKNNGTVEYDHYFATDGKTICFERSTVVENGHADSVNYREEYARAFDSNFKVVGKFYNLSNFWGKKLKYAGQMDNLRYSYTIYKNVDECLKAYNIPAQ